MFYKYIEFICDMNHYMHIYMYIHILHFNGHSLSHYLIISSIFKIDFKIDPYLLFFIEEHLDSFLFSLVQIIPQWPLLSTSYFFFLSSLLPSFLPYFLFNIQKEVWELWNKKKADTSNCSPKIVFNTFHYPHMKFSVSSPYQHKHGHISIISELMNMKMLLFVAFCYYLLPFPY